MQRTVRLHVITCLAALLVCAAITPIASAETPTTEVDVLVYGATPAGICAAVAASREGASVALVSPYDYVGGVMSGGLSLSDSNQCVRRLMGGLFVEVHTRIYRHYEDTGVKLNYNVDLAKNDKWTYEPHVAEMVFHDLLEEASVAVHLEHKLVGMTKESTRIETLKTSKGVFRAGQFIDATYEGDLMAAADVSYAVGREGKKQYGESLAGHQLPKKPVKVVPLDEAGKPLPLLTGNALGEDSGDEKIMTYSFRVVISTDPNNRLRFPEPANYDPARFELARRYIKATPKAAGGMVAVDGYPLPGKKVDLNNGIGRQISSGLVGASWAWPEATYDEREKIWEAHKQYTLELIWFLKTDPAVPEKVRKKYAAYGLAKDEFQRYGGWPPALYIREGRRMIGEHVLTQHDVRRDITKGDSIGISSFPIDSHDCQRLPTTDGKAWVNEGTIFPERINGNRHGQPYQVPYRSLTPKRDECVNLLVPVCLSSTHVALSSIRVEPTWMMLGQSAGIAAAMAHATKTDVQKLPYDALKQRLLKQMQVIDFPADTRMTPATNVVASKMLPGIVLDDREAKKRGMWKDSQNFRPFIGEGYVHDDKAGDGAASLTFTTKIQRSGRYNVRLAYSPHETRASNVPMSVTIGDKCRVIFVNQRLALDTGSAFRTVATLDLEAGQTVAIQFSNDQTDGFVVIDALQLVKHLRPK
ncbi:MAG TPA: FAD-dependent oxidoreductase [Pirellulaceae bacterium]|nr:FAD-dependent oxidoreductase [Pirellulaceae bacterium]